MAFLSNGVSSKGRVNRLRKTSKPHQKIRNATPTVDKGIKYRSKLESEIAQVLEQEGVPFKYECMKLSLLPTFKYLNETVRGWTYTPDFLIYDNIMVEVKGFPNDAWPLKKKMILKYIVDNNYQYEFYEIHSKTQMLKLLNELKSRTQCNSNI